jgi:hypothetical protein
MHAEYLTYYMLVVMNTLFIYLFNDAFSSSLYVPSNGSIFGE